MIPLIPLLGFASVLVGLILRGRQEPGKADSPKGKTEIHNHYYQVLPESVKKTETVAVLQSETMDIEHSEETTDCEEQEEIS